MALTPYNDNINIQAPKPIDYRMYNSGGLAPYSNILEAIDFITYKYEGLTILVSSSIEELTEYWWKNGQFVIKNQGSGSGGSGLIINNNIPYRVLLANGTPTSIDASPDLIYSGSLFIINGNLVSSSSLSPIFKSKNNIDSYESYIDSYSFNLINNGYTSSIFISGSLSSNNSHSLQNKSGVIAHLEDINNVFSNIPDDIEIVVSSSGGIINDGDVSSSFIDFIGWKIRFYRNFFKQPTVDIGQSYYVWDPFSGIINYYPAVSEGEIIQIEAYKR